MDGVGLAFGLATGAGCCTAIGACIAFVAGLKNNRLLAASLGASAGVMMFDLNQ